MTRKFSAFISHSSKDAAFAMQLVASMEARGFTSWIAPRDVDPGAPWAEEIDRGIAESNCFILVLSESANLSQAVLNEVTVAFQKGKPVFPVRIENVAPSTALNFYIASFHWIDALDGLAEDRVERLIASMRDDRERARRAAGPSQKGEDPFTVPLNSSGPILPPPRSDEIWVDAIDQESVKRSLAGLRNSKTPRDRQRLFLAWENNGWGRDRFRLFVGAERRVGLVHASKFESTGVDDAFRRIGALRESITDMTVAFSDGRLTVATERGIYKIASDGHFEVLCRSEKVFAEDISQIEASADRGRLAQLCYYVGNESSSLLSRLLGRVDFSGTKGTRLRVVHSGSRAVRISKFREECGRVSFARLSWSPSGRFVGISGLYEPEVAVVQSAIIGADLSLLDFKLTADHGINCSSLAWHPTRDICATAYTLSAEPLEFGFLIFDAETRELILRQRISRRDRAYVVVWSPDGSVIAMGGHDDAIFLWDFRTGRELVLLGHRDTVRDLHFSPDGTRLLSAADDGKVIIWDCKRPNKPISTFDGMLSGSTRRIKGSAWSPTGRMFAMFHGDGIRVMELT